MEYVSTVTLVIGVIWTITGFVKNDFNYIVGAQPWLATTLILEALPQ